jgi:hypothetical protein
MGPSSAVRCTLIAQLGTRLEAMNASSSPGGKFGTKTTLTNACAAGDTGSPFETVVKKCSGPQMG